MNLNSSVNLKADSAEFRMNANIPLIDGLRVISVLEKAIERLQLLSLLNYDAYPNSNEQYLEIKGMEDNTTTGVGSILGEQKRLEQRYEELLIATAHQKDNAMDPALDQSCFSFVDNVVERQQREELKSISAQLKEFSKQLTRQLKENPNDSDNWKKVLNERSESTNMLAACVKELSAGAASAIIAPVVNSNTMVMQAGGGNQLLHFDTTSQRSGDGGSIRSHRSNSAIASRLEISYEVFAKKVIDEQNEKIWADEIVKREKETNMNVKQLQTEVTEQRLLKEKEIEDRQVKLSELKTQLRHLKQETKESSEKKKAETDAQAEARAREASNTRRLLLDKKIDYLQKKLEIENEVFSSIQDHLDKKSSQLQTKTAEWTVRQVDENKDIDDNITTENRKREDQKERLKQCEDRHLLETERKLDREENERRTEQESKRWDDLHKSEYIAATKLQAAFKAFLIRKVFTDMKKKKKKGGGGKKK